MIAEMVGFGDEIENCARPIPERATPWGLPVALSLILKVPLRVPLAIGANTTLAVQLCPGPRVLKRGAEEQVLVWVKSPVTLIVVISSVDVPVFVMVTVCAAVVEPTVVFAKVKVVGVTVTEVAWVTPVPVTVMMWGLFGVLSSMLNSSVTEPVASGVKVMLMLHVPPRAATVPTQLSDSVKSLLGGVIELITKGKLPMSTIVTVCVVLAMLTVWFPKFSF